MRVAYKALTHDYRPPIQGGAPVFDGRLPFALPPCELDRSDTECAPGWNACATPEQVVRIVGLWTDGWPVRLYRVETDTEVIERGNKLRAATWTLVEECPIRPAVQSLSREWFGDLAGPMAEAQSAWHEALGRPLRDETAAEAGLREALRARGLETWTLRRYPAARAARAAWEAWAAWDAWAALVVEYAARRGWVSVAQDMLTVGLREAYRHGLAIAIPTGPGELGWSMVEDGGADAAP